MLKKYKQVLIFLILTSLWTAFIFSMSLKSAAESGELSGGLVAWLTNTVLAPIFGNIPDLEHYIRKLAHFTEFGILGMLAGGTGSSLLWKKSKRFRGLSAALYCVLVAATDETIQLFVPGRSGQVADVILDSAGAVCGILLSVLIFRRNDSREKIDNVVK